ncbi:hypothetical protein SLITO_v1c11080 [Spiroplasma litorale]|uniref:Transmembrane protein n=1 Tax=Spiroplasma litorale TaxID=216942 RepID=A0A0K1W323_9MOLU|nr:hypothetical protein [Spiroplasma litorale]AKX34719.1 hypothetical protein SLITO_v1c11080 [Spiroplasma litorale]
MKKLINIRIIFISLLVIFLTIYLFSSALNRKIDNLNYYIFFVSLFIFSIFIVVEFSKIISKINNYQIKNELKNPKISLILIDNLVLFKKFFWVAFPILIINIIFITDDIKKIDDLNYFIFLIFLITSTLFLNLVFFTLLVVLKNKLKSKKINQLDQAFANDVLVLNLDFYIDECYSLNYKNINILFENNLISFLSLIKNSINLIIKIIFSQLLNLFKKSNTPPNLIKKSIF